MHIKQARRSSTADLLHSRSFLRVPTVKPLPIVDMLQADCEILRNWSLSHGAAVRQQTVRQETTMAKHGPLPEFMYQRNCVALDNPVTIINGKRDSVEAAKTADDETVKNETEDEKFVTEVCQCFKGKSESRETSSLVH